MFPTVVLGNEYLGTNNQSYFNNGNDSHALLGSLTKTAGRQTIIAGIDGRLHRIDFITYLPPLEPTTSLRAQTGGPNAVTGTGGD